MTHSSTDEANDLDDESPDPPVPLSVKVHRSSGGILLGSMIVGGLLVGTFGFCVMAPIGGMVGMAVGNWLDPGSSSRPHAFEEPPAILGMIIGMLIGWSAGAVGGMLLVRSVSLSNDLEDLEKSSPEESPP